MDDTGTRLQGVAQGGDKVTDKVTDSMCESFGV